MWQLACQLQNFDTQIVLNMVKPTKPQTQPKPTLQMVKPVLFCYGTKMLSSHDEAVSPCHKHSSYQSHKRFWQSVNAVTFRCKIAKVESAELA